MTDFLQRPTTSITRELDSPTSALRNLLKPHQPVLDQWRRQAISSLSGRPWIRPQRTRLAWMSGHAIDLRIRWWLTGVDELPGPVLSGLAHCAPRTIEDLLDTFETIRGTPAGVIGADPEHKVCAVAIAAASVEPLYRAGPVPCALADLGWAEFLTQHADVLDDVVKLSAGLQALIGRYADSSIECGTITGVGRLGGDADFVAGSELVEIKCVVDPKGSARRAIQQLFVYAARLRPATAALVFPRQHTTISFDLGGLAAQLAELNEEVCEAYG